MAGTVLSPPSPRLRNQRAEALSSLKLFLDSTVLIRWAAKMTSAALAGRASRNGIATT